METAPVDLAAWIEPRVDTDPDVRSLTAAIVVGDTAAFTRFFRARFDQMLGDARRATGRDESFCHDVVQDAMMRVLKSLKVMDTEPDLRRWLRAVVQSCAYDRLRAEARRRRRETRPAPVSHRDDDLHDRLVWIEQQLRSLDDHNADLLLMRHRFGWTLRQIGSALGISPGAADGRLRRIVRTLRHRARSPEERHD